MKKFLKKALVGVGIASTLMASTIIGGIGDRNYNADINNSQNVATVNQGYDILPSRVFDAVHGYDQFSFVSDSGKNITYHVINKSDENYDKEMLERNVNYVYNDLSNMGYTMPQDFNFLINQEGGGEYHHNDNKIIFDHIFTHSEDSLQDALKHEMFHMAQFNTVSKTIPSWVVEGDAEFYTHNGICNTPLSVHPSYFFDISFYNPSSHDGKHFNPEYFDNYTHGCIAVEYMIENGVDMVDFYKLINEKRFESALISSGFTTEEINRYVTERAISNIKNDEYSETVFDRDSNGNLISTTTDIYGYTIFEEFDSVTGNKIFEEISHENGEIRHSEFENGILTYELYEYGKIKSETTFENGNKISTTRINSHGDKFFIKFNPLTSYRIFEENTNENRKRTRKFENGFQTYQLYELHDSSFETTFNRNSDGDLLSTNEINSYGDKFFTEFNPITGNKIFEKVDYKNGYSSETTYNTNSDGHILSSIEIFSDGSESFTEFNPLTGNTIKITHTKSNGVVTETIFE